jgi:hydroxyacylglutathione hydrolase
MNLEDHLGDVLRKGRDAAGKSAGEAARAAGLGEAEWLAAEESGHLPATVNWTGVGAVLGMNPGKLQGLQKGWRPADLDLGTWRELRRITTTAEGITVHCYLVWDEVSREAALFDTGWDPAPIFALIEENSLQLKHLFITHTHADHVGAMAAIRERFPKLHLHTSAKSAPPQHRNRSNDFLHLGSLRITNRDTPGHAEDGVTYIVGSWPDDASHVAFVGDAVFAGSMGKGNQSWELARQKVRENIFFLPDETLLCPGHGPATTVGEEKKMNPFF